MTKRTRSTVLRRALWVLVALSLVEVLLQVVAWRLWATEWVGPSEGPRPGLVLVLGSDEVFDRGVRLRDDAWPGAAGRALRAEGRAVEVENRAWLARDSRDVLLRAPLQLTLERPDIVAVCVGVDDFRRRAAGEVTETELRGRNAPFAWRFRLPGLVARWVSKAATAERDVGALLGPWHFGDTAFAFEVDGTFLMGSIPTRWEVEDGELRIALPSAEVIVVEWTLEGDRLDLRGAFPGGRLTLDRGPVLAGAAERARASLARGDLVEAEVALLPAVRGAAADPDAVVALVELEASLGRVDAARGFAGRLAVPPRDRAQRARLARARIALGEVGAGVDLVLEDLPVHAGDAVLLEVLRALPPGSDADRVAARATAALAEAPVVARPALAWLAAALHGRAGRSQAALRAGVGGLAAVDGEADPRAVPASVRRASDEDWGVAVAAVAPARGDRLAAQRAALVEADRATAAILAANLRRLVELIRFYGAEPILLDPADDVVASAVRREVAAELGVRLSSCSADRGALADAFEAGIRDVLDERAR